MEDDDEMLDETEPTPDGADEEDPAEGTPEGDPDPDAAEEGEDPTDDGEAEDDEAEDEGEGALPQGVRKRLAKVTAKRRAAEARAKVTAKRRAAEARAKELEDEVARLRDRAESPALYRALAERHGILPDLIGEREAKGLRDLDEAERGAEALRDLLEELEDNGESETELDGRTVTRAQLRKSLREQERRARDLRERHGEVGERLRRRTLALVKLGLAAEKAQAARAAKAGELTEEDFKAKLLEARQNAGRALHLTGFVGLNLKLAFADFLGRITTVTDAKNPVREITQMVDFLKYDVGDVKLIALDGLDCDTSTLEPGTLSGWSGAFIEPEHFQLEFAQPVTHFDQTSRLDNGGGPRGYHHAMFRLNCTGLLGSFRVTKASA